MTSSRPYLVRAIYDWIVDNDLTPYLLVNAELPNVTVPQQYIQDGRIILNVSPSAVRDLQMTDDWVMFSARFGGVSMSISVPPSAVMAVYAKENGRGMVFSDDDENLGDEAEAQEDAVEASLESVDEAPESPDDPPPASPPGKGRPTLRVVK